MNVLLSTAAGLLVADAFCKNREPTSRRVSMSSSSSSSDPSSSDSCSHPKRSNRRRGRNHRNLPIRPPSHQSSLATSSTSTTSVPSDEPTTTDSDSSDLSSNSSSDPSSDSSGSTVKEYHRIRHGRLPKNIKHRSQLPNYHTLMTRYISPERYSSSDCSSNDTSSSVTVSSSSGSEPEHSSDSDSESDSDYDSNALSSPSTISPSHNALRSLPTTSPLHNRLSTFLPTIRASNADLERERLAGTLHNKDIENLHPASDGESSSEEERPYIEMNLGLGVLEEKEKGGGDITPSGNKRERSRESEIRRPAVEDGTSPFETLIGRRGGRTPERRQRKRRKVGIEVID
ncbi:MAG: hypothetical protein Q9169_001044 [Polycauliona sp. 2 TL-2023]